ncbi:ATP-dependent zinc metalloprotease [Rhynchospora pubera]|uniref:ATP-dependent zinc metalloprotease n=1 Tax=Rhynchospora pubera TaxID=906938 RepID=A0AAV8H2V3_9POAL|nr:ATP-dependent zinc metalloprotease [Rhynchospora pubera]
MAVSSSFSPFPSLLYPSSTHSPLSLPLKFLPSSKPHLLRSRIKALQRWREYEDAVRDKDLARALRFLQSTQSSSIDSSSDSNSKMNLNSGFSTWDWDRPERDWEILDTCLNADDMRLVGSAYGFLQDRGFLSNFGKCRDIVIEGPREVTPKVLKEYTGLEAIKLAPKKWGMSGASQLALIAFLGGASFLVSQGIEIRPNLAAILALATADAIFLGGTCLAQISCFWPPYKRRILIHEAGHLLTAYLMGCPIRGVILDPFVALQMGIQGQAGTQFWDENMESELAEGRLSSTAFDRYCMVLFAGIAAEALVYGEAEGGENDENLFRSLCVLLRPPLSVPEMANRARWSVMQSYNLLKWHKRAHTAAVKALEAGHSLSVVIRRIEESLSSGV